MSETEFGDMKLSKAGLGEMGIGETGLGKSEFNSNGIRGITIR